MSMLLRLTGAWTGLLTDWLDTEALPAPDIRAALAHYAPDDAVPAEVWRDLLTSAVALRPEHTAPELAIGSGVQPHHVGVLGYLVLATDTLGEAMLAYQRYERLFYGVNVAEVAISGDSTELRWPATAVPLGQLADGAAIAALITFLRRQWAEPLSPMQVRFSGEPHSPEAEEAYAAFFRCPVVFNDVHVAVRFPTPLLALPMPHRDPALRTLLDRQAQALLRTMPESSAFHRALRQALPRLLTDGRGSLHDMAAALHMSPRTLQRRLSEHGANWQQFLDHARAGLAAEYLADHTLSLSDVALLLGFSEQSAFTRAFRRWHGSTPGRWRRHASELPSALTPLAPDEPAGPNKDD